MRPKSFIKRAIAVFTVSLLLVVGVSAMATGGFMTRFFDEHSSLSKTTEALENMSSAQLVKAVAAAAEEAEQNFNEENFMYFATALLERADEFSDEELTGIALNENYSELMRILAIQILGQTHNYKFESSDLLNMLNDENLSSEIRKNIMAICDFSSEEANQQLRELADVSDPDIFFHAMKRLQQSGSESDLETASAIADTIIADYSSYHEKIVRAAILAKSRALSAEHEIEGTTDTDIEEFISFCSNFHDVAIDQVAQDTAIIGLKRLHRPESIEAIIKNDEFDRVMKVGAVSYNADILYQMLEEDTSESNIELICCAMDLYPISDFAAPLREIYNDMSVSRAYSED